MRNLQFVPLMLAATLSMDQGFAAGHMENHCKITPIRTNAVDFPSKHAWDLFMTLNHPAVDDGSERGLPDCGVPIGEVERVPVWETWRNASTEVFLDDGSEPPNWNDASLESYGRSTSTLVGQYHEKLSNLSQVPNDSESRTFLSFHSIASAIIKPSFDPDQGVFQGEGAFGETRMNKPTYEFIKQNCLWSKDGQVRYATAIGEGKKGPIIFPPNSIEVKAAWIDFSNPDPNVEDEAPIPEHKWDEYYHIEHSGNHYGLVSFHIFTKDIPNWFWATFHHVSSPSNPYETPDLFGRPAELDGTLWENYVLGGTQIDFVTPSGDATILSDHYIEFGFQRSSCITCHAHATISADASPGPTEDMSLCILNGSLPDLGLTAEYCKSVVGEQLYIPGTDMLWEERGTPIGEWFQKDGDQFHFQTDFVWSLITEARAELSSPPKRCEW